MSDMYAFKTSTLTALGDAVREMMGMTPFSDSLYFGIADNQYKTTTLSQASKNKFIINLVDGLWDDYDAIEICSSTTNPSLNRLLYENIRRVQFPVEIVADCPQLVIKCAIGKSAHFLDLDIITMPLDENGGRKYTLTEMIEILDNLPPAPSPNNLIISGTCQYKFANGGWDWFIEKYGDQITTKDITNCNNMFNGCLVDVPFTINLKSGHNASMDYMFSNYKGTVIPAIHGAKPSTLSNMFSNTFNILEIPEDICDDWDWSYIDEATSAYNGGMSSMCNGCYKLRKLPMKLFEHGNPNINYSYSIFRTLASNCYSLDEIIDLPNPHYAGTYTGSGYSGVINEMLPHTWRLKNFTFAPMEIAPKWANQTLDLSTYCGWTNNASGYTYMAPGIDLDTKVIDDDSYQRLKDNPDWWTANVAYSRYNHDSAVRTINSLPDTSATGSNTIKFRGAAGEKTDGGAINTLTDEEIAVAAAKGWTVAFA